ncbi:hypothetical protein [Haliea sp. E17]|uniref:hypothetical protein n=1 Tax=Haliea sp. E17 TaxID=3401576 RepID=UPI003AAC8F7E
MKPPCAAGRTTAVGIVHRRRTVKRPVDDVDVYVVLFARMREGVELTDELAMRDVVHGRPVKNVEALARPEAGEL